MSAFNRGQGWLLNGVSKMQTGIILLKYISSLCVLALSYFGTLLFTLNYIFLFRPLFIRLIP